MRLAGTRIYSVSRIFGVWACLFQTVTGGICRVTAPTLQGLNPEIDKVNNDLRKEGLV